MFGIPGVGRLMIDSIFARDYAVVQGLTMVLCVLVSVVFLLVDALQALLDPKDLDVTEAVSTAGAASRLRAHRCKTARRMRG